MSREPWDLPMTSSFTFLQNADSCQEGDLPQQLTVSTEDAGGGPYLVLSTERWALDPGDIPRLAALLRRCAKGKPGARDYFNEEPDE